MIERHDRHYIIQALRGIVVLLLVVLVVGCNKETRAWENASTINSISEYELFISEYPNSIYIDSAMNKLLILHWEEAKFTNKI